MVNDLINIENIQTDFCIYEIEYETREYETRVNVKTGMLESKPKPGKAVWHTHHSFHNLTDRYKTSLKVEYRYAIDKQIEISRKYGLDFSSMLSLIRRLIETKLIPLSLQPRKEIIKFCRSKRMPVKRISANEDYIRSHKSIQLYKHNFRAQLISYLMQKREDIFTTTSIEDKELYDRMIKVFVAMNTDTTNCITFNQAVENLYDKMVRWNNEM